MRLRLDTIALSGLENLDTGLRALTLIPSVANGAAMLYGATGPGGGITAYRFGADGLPVLADSALFAPDFTALPARRIAPTPDGAALVLGATPGGAMLWGLEPDGGIGPATIQPFTSGSLMTQATTLAMHTGPGTAPRLAVSGGTMSGGDTTLLSWPGGAPLTGTDAAADLGFTGNGTLLVATRDGALVSLAPDGETDRLGAEQGLAVGGASALATIAAHGTEFAILAAAGSGSLSVADIAASGMSLRDHVLDTRTTRFGSVQDVAAAEINGQVFVVAGGGDDGLSLLTLLPDGRLVHLHALENGPGGGLDGVTRLAMGQIGGGLRVFASTDGDAGITALSLPGAGSGTVMRGGGTQTGGAGQDLLVAENGDAILSGGAGDDILVAGPGATLMTGGTGADLFVMTDGAGPVSITDFNVGEDRLDLSDYMMLRAPSQLEVLPTADGATIRYRAHEVQLHNANGTTLAADDLFGPAFDWPDRMPLLTPDPGTGGGDTGATDGNTDGNTDGGTGDGDTGGGTGADTGGNSGNTPSHGGWAVTLSPDAGHALVAGATVAFAPDTGTPLSLQADAAGRFDLSAVTNQGGTLTLSRAHDPGTDPRIGVMDALEVLRMAVGMDPTYGPASPADLIAADIGGNGRVDVFDALTVLNVALGFDVATPPVWRFLDAGTDLSGVRADNTTVADGIRLDIPESGVPDISLTALLTGHIEGW